MVFNPPSSVFSPRKPRTITPIVRTVLFIDGYGHSRAQVLKTINGIARHQTLDEMATDLFFSQTPTSYNKKNISFQSSFLTFSRSTSDFLFPNFIYLFIFFFEGGGGGLFLCRFYLISPITTETNAAHKYVQHSLLYLYFVYRLVSIIRWQFHSLSQQHLYIESSGPSLLYKNVLWRYEQLISLSFGDSKRNICWVIYNAALRWL